MFNMLILYVLNMILRVIIVLSRYIVDALIVVCVWSVFDSIMSSNDLYVINYHV